ncbi:MAG: TerC family protein [Lautropia sp.]
MIESLGTAVVWIALLKIIWVNILLSGDNAVVIALAARGLPDHQRSKAVFLGSAAAIVLRIALTVFAVQLLQYPYLKLIGALLLFWIGVQLLLPEDGEDGIKQNDQLWAAVKTILVADLVMSLDNVIAVAAAADGGPPESRLMLLIVGLALSIPLIIFGSQLLLKVMERFPVIIPIGAGLLGFVAIEMLLHEPALDGVVHDWPDWFRTMLELAGAAAVVVVGTVWARRKTADAARAQVGG